MSSYGGVGQTAVEPELQGRTPRRVRYTGGTQTARLILWLLFLGGVGLIAHLGSEDVGQLKALRAHGKTATAHVTGFRVSHGKHNTYYLEYMFMTDNGVVSDSEDVSHSKYSETREGDPLTITYLPGDPDTHRVGEVGDRYVEGSTTQWLIGGAIAFLLLGGLTGAVEANFRRSRRLLQDGQAVLCTVTERKQSTYQSKSGPQTTYTLCYRFSTPQGEQTGKGTVKWSLYDGHPSGTTLTVLYDSGNPARSRIYRTMTDVCLL